MWNRMWYCLLGKWVKWARERGRERECVWVCERFMYLNCCSGWRHGAQYMKHDNVCHVCWKVYYGNFYVHLLQHHHKPHITIQFIHSLCVCTAYIMNCQYDNGGLFTSFLASAISGRIENEKKNTRQIELVCVCLSITTHRLWRRHQQTLYYIWKDSSSSSSSSATITSQPIYSQIIMKASSGCGTVWVASTKNINFASRLYAE